MQLLYYFHCISKKTFRTFTKSFVFLYISRFFKLANINNDQC